MTRQALGVGLALALAASAAGAQGMGGVYFRGDVGVAVARNASIEDKTPGVTFNNLCDGAGTCGFDLDDIGESAAVTVGVGYRLGSNFRVDVTGGYRPGFELDDSIASVPGGRDRHTADIDVTTVMLSGYYDFTLSGSAMRPYVGAGLGWARNEIGTTTVTNPTTGLNRTHGGDTESNFAWQVGAGVAIPLQGSMSVDVAYKYVDAGELDSGASTVRGNFGPGAFPFNGVEGDVAFHELTVGLRF